ncbi:hypothetical protein MJO29_009207 [Puccinia striiformis f. sp. tritici]|nr:hypothetical protein MJO29_009207 [Puccinia striiformis f. sp. tritici]
MTHCQQISAFTGLIASYRPTKEIGGPGGCVVSYRPTKEIGGPGGCVVSYRPTKEIGGPGGCTHPPRNQTSNAKALDPKRIYQYLVISLLIYPCSLLEGRN